MSDEPKKPPARLVTGHGPSQVLAIAASLAAEYPQMLEDTNILRPLPELRPPPEPEHISFQPLPGLSPPPSRMEIRDEVHFAPPPKTAKHSKLSSAMRRSGKPAGSKLARKAARGKL